MTRLAPPFRRIVARIWGTLYEPRAVTAVMVAVYGIAAGVGLALVVLPPALPILAGGWMQYAAGVFFLSGVVGAPSAWAGAWWIERVAALACTGGAAVAGWLLLAIYPPTDDLVWALVLAGVTFAVLFFVTRFLRVRTRAHAPGHGPPSGEEAAAARAALDED